jgi:hypothetical protein
MAMRASHSRDHTRIELLPVAVVDERVCPSTKKIVKEKTWGDSPLRYTYTQYHVMKGRYQFGKSEKEW